MTPDDELMRRYAGGDARAFERLYARWEERVYGFCLRRIGDPDTASDAFQETWRRVIDARERYEARGRFGGWLFTLARRACIDLLRARTSGPVLPADATPEGGEEAADRRGGSGGSTGGAVGGDGGVFRARDPRQDPGRRLEVRDRLGRLLGRLTEAQREALLLSKYEGFDYREVARITGSTEAAVKQRVYRALRKLRESGA